MKDQNRVRNTSSLQTREYITKKALDATVFIEMQDRNGDILGVGSGFFIKYDQIATNLHIIEGAAQGIVKLIGGYAEYAIEGVTATDEKNNLVVLKVTAYSIEPLSLGESDSVKIGDPVHVAKNTIGSEGMFTDGIINGKRETSSNERFQVIAPVSPESSGGPVLNSKGEVIAVSFMTLEGEGNPNFANPYLNFAIPSNLLKALLTRLQTAQPLPEETEPISAVTHFNWGFIMHQQKNYDDAITSYTNAIRLRPNFAIGYALRGLAYQELKQYRNAIADYDEATRLAPDYTTVYCNRGLAKDRLGQYLDAVADYDEAIRLSPDLAEAYANRGLAKRHLGQISSANNDFQIALELAEGNDDKELKAQIKKMCQDFETQTIPKDALAYHNRGLAKCYQGQHAAGVSDFDKAIKIKPDYIDAYLNRGAAKIDLEQYSAAIADFNTVIQLKPDDYNAYYNLGEAKDKQGQYSAAIADFNRAIQLKPDYFEAYLSRGVAKAKLEQLSAAIADFNTVIQLKPDSTLAYYNRGAAYCQLDRTSESNQDFQTALRLAEQAGDERLKTHIQERWQYLKERAIPDNVLAYYKQGCKKNDSQEYVAAIADFDKALQLKPDYAPAYFNRGNAKANLNQYTAAIADYDAAIQLKLEAADVYHNRGLVKGRLNLNVAAIADLDEAIRLDPDYPSAYLYRGIAKALLNHASEAERDFLTALKLAEETGDENTKTQAQKALSVRK